MNFKLIKYLLGFIFRIEAVAMAVPLCIALYDKDYKVAAAFLASMGLLFAFSLFGLKKPKGKTRFYVREGLVTVGLVWVAVSLFGALPFWASGQIPSFVDALFESVSGFTTTGASILSNVEGLSRGLIFWRSFTHFAGGMGVLVFVLAIIPMADSSGGSSLYLLRAESTGPQVGKLLPKMKDSAKVLYIIYLSLTALMIVLMLVGGASLFDSVTISMGTAGTGGFGIKNDSLAQYSPCIKTIVGVFMALFGINFNIYFLLKIKEWRKALKNEELRVYLGIMAFAIVLIWGNLLRTGQELWPALGDSAFQVSSIMTSTGFSTVDFNLWPQFSKTILAVLMIIGASAGSTGGGIKVTRVLILVKSAKNNMMKVLRPRQVNRVRLDSTALDDETVQGVLGYMSMYGIIAVVSLVLISWDNFSIGTNLSAVLATLNNIGPGFEQVGPMASFAAFSPFSKVILIFNMLIGRLELFPVLLLFTPAVWRKTS